MGLAGEMRMKMIAGRLRTIQYSYTCIRHHYFFGNVTITLSCFPSTTSASIFLNAHSTAFKQSFLFVYGKV